jgi:hypothetical protein
LIGSISNFIRHTNLKFGVAHRFLPGNPQVKLKINGNDDSKWSSVPTDFISYQMSIADK